MASSIIGKSRWCGRPRGQRQFPVAEAGGGRISLIEVLISMVILTVGMVSLLGVFGLAMSRRKPRSRT